MSVMVDVDNDNDDDNEINRQDDINNDGMKSAHLKQLPLPIRNVVFQVNIFSKRFHIELKKKLLHILHQS